MSKSILVWKCMVEILFSNTLLIGVARHRTNIAIHVLLIIIQYLYRYRYCNFNYYIVISNIAILE